MTIEETIENLDQIAKNQLECADKIDELNCDSTSTRNMASYHKQLAEWLKELKIYREILIDRPCEVCKFHKTGSCSRWKCVFEGGKS